MNYKELIPKLDKNKLPQHIAVIMDGNGRWAKKNHTIRLNGHRKGVKAVREIVEVAAEMQIQYLTIYAFSTENWNRSTGEVSGLLKLIMNSLINEIEDLNKNNVNIRFIGSTEKLSGEYIAKVNENCRKTWNNKGLHLNVAMNYGGRIEILEGIKKMYDDIIQGKITKEDIKKLKKNVYALLEGSIINKKIGGNILNIAPDKYEYEVLLNGNSVSIPMICYELNDEGENEYI